MNPRTVAIVGATGAVGKDLLAVLAARNYPLRQLRLYASPRSVGQRLQFCGESLPVEALGRDSFRGVEVALFSAGSSTTREHGLVATASGNRPATDSAPISSRGGAATRREGDR